MSYYLVCFKSSAGQKHRAYRERYYKTIKAVTKREALMIAKDYRDNMQDEIVTGCRFLGHWGAFEGVADNEQKAEA